MKSLEMSREKAQYKKGKERVEGRHVHVKGNCHSPCFFRQGMSLSMFVRENLAVPLPKSVSCQLERSFYFRVLPEFTLVWILLLLARGSRRRRRLQGSPVSKRAHESRTPVLD